MCDCEALQNELRRIRSDINNLRQRQDQCCGSSNGGRNDFVRRGDLPALLKPLLLGSGGLLGAYATKDQLGQFLTKGDSYKLFNDFRQQAERAYAKAPAVRDAVNRANDAAKKSAEALNKSNSALDKAKNAGKDLLDKFNKLDKAVGRATAGIDKFISAASLGFGIAGSAISIFSLWQSEANQAAFDRQVNRFQVDMSKQWSTMQLLKNRIDALRNETAKRLQILEREANLSSDAIRTVRTYADRAYKLANDGLYEARTRIQRLNDGLYVAKSQAQQATVKNQQQDIQINALKSQAYRAEQSAKTAQTEAQQARVGVKLVDSKATIAQATAKTAEVKATQATVAATQANAKAVSLQPSITQAITTANRAVAIAQGMKIPPPITTVVNNNTTTTATQQRMSQSEFNQYLRQNGIILRVDAVQTTANTALEVASKGASEPIGSRALGIGSSALSLGANNTAKLNQLDAELKQLKANPPSLLDPRVPELQQKIKERETVDNAAVQKLNEIQQQNSLLVPALIAGLTPAMQSIVGFNTGQIRGDISQLPERTATATQAAPCNRRGCGGSTAARVNELGDDLANLRNQVNGLPNTFGNVVNGANAAANLEQLSLLRTINGKLGSLLPNGGISGMLSRIVKSSAVDKALQVMTFIGVVHNAVFLSADLAQSLFSLSSSAINATLRTMGVITADDTPIDVGQIISSAVENHVKALFGVQAWEEMTRKFAAINRIISSAANVIWTVQSIADSARSLSEYIAENTGKIGNALKRWRVIGEKAFPDLPERINAGTAWQRKADDIMNGISEATNDISMLDSAFQEVISINDSLNQLSQDREEFKKSIEESNLLERPANLAAKTRRDTEKAASSNPDTVATVSTAPSED